MLAALGAMGWGDDGLGSPWRIDLPDSRHTYMEGDVAFLGPLDYIEIGSES